MNLDWLNEISKSRVGNTFSGRFARIKTERRIALRYMRLIEAVMSDPCEGIGKPEPLKHEQPNTWSRRIDDEHRLVYVVYDNEIHFISGRYHYSL